VTKTYKIIRYYRGADEGSEIIARGLTWEQAQEHFKCLDSQGPDWIDGYKEEKS
jgi:hypothetical protein